MKVGFVGLGAMGSGMARNLIKAGHNVTVYNRTRSRADELKPDGAIVADTAAQAASGAEAVFTMLADDHALEEITFGAGKLLESLPAGSVHLSASTISVRLSRRLTAAHRERGQHYLAAPVFGRPDAAAAAKLFVVAAGPQFQIERCQPLFSAIGQRTFVAGAEPPMANVVKLAGNFLITTIIEGLAESFALARKSEVDPGQMLEILTGSLFPAPIYKNYGAMVAHEKFEPVGFKLKLGAKDNRLVLSAAEEAGVPMPIASLVRDQFLAAMAQGMAEDDWAAVSKVVYKNAGL
ncbi:MAG TPA: NAD(P)-dependent oxidoreductase [Candidatus Angelobacter sp.]|nr:NAD(P)-dependent oxidoreductase [Candidatus Angelobacter sp.]